MLPTISIVCQEGGHAIALEYAKLVKDAGLRLLVNFPSAEGYLIADDPTQLINRRTGALIAIVSMDLFPASGKSPKFKIDTAIIQNLLSLSTTNARSRLFLIVIDEESEALIEGTWMARLQYLRDGAITREQILTNLKTLIKSDIFGDEISSFNEVATIISDIEPGCTIDEIASERVSSESISYEIFECRHKIRKDATYYIHLHRGITISNTARHIEEHYPRVFSSSSKFALLGIEKGQSRLEQRLANVKSALHCEEAEYLEDIVFKLISDQIDAESVSDTGAVAREFLEPQVRKGISSASGVPASDYSKITDWLVSPRSGVLVLVGQGGIGKTWAMLNLRQRITRKRITFAKKVDRTVIFITSTDINRGSARAFMQKRDITLYDLYLASTASMNEDETSSNWLSKETFYNALELGNLVVFVDGLDEVIARNRSRFSATQFFDDLNQRLTGESDGKVIISCRNIFFDEEEYRLRFPYVETFQLLAFDGDQRDHFFGEVLKGLPSRVQKACELSEQLAGLPDGRYVPFVLSLIKDMMLEQADESSQAKIETFQSTMLSADDQNDRIVGQFCNRETYKVSAPIQGLTVDQQVQVFCLVARNNESEHGLVNRSALEGILNIVLGRKDVSDFCGQLLAHPFIAQEEIKKRGVIEFRFDFMPEYFLMLDAVQRVAADAKLERTDITIFNKYCNVNSAFGIGIAARFPGEMSDFRLLLIDWHEKSWVLIQDLFPPEDLDVLQPDSAIAQFSFSLVSLLATYEAMNGRIDLESFTEALKELFVKEGALRRMALLDGFVREEERLRIDFRGVEVEECLFHSVDIWDCQYDENSVFRNCRFMNCIGVPSKSSGVNTAIFEPSCQFDAEFERLYETIHKKIESTETNNVDSIRSFVSDFHRQGGFRKLSRENVERYYGASNSYVPFKKIYRLMKKHGVIEESDKGHYFEVTVTSSASADSERLITQGVIGGLLKKVAVDLN